MSLLLFLCLGLTIIGPAGGDYNIVFITQCTILQGTVRYFTLRCIASCCLLWDVVHLMLPTIMYIYFVAPHIPLCFQAMMSDEPSLATHSSLRHELKQMIVQPILFVCCRTSATSPHGPRSQPSSTSSTQAHPTLLHQQHQQLAGVS